ncbi:MAG: HEPN domain-containing protein [Chloroflexi bacterium]|nr:HEPN domain-containing protein [Chloroflexota bacterium]
MLDVAALHLAIARSSLDGARSEIDHRRFDNAANRLYYACFQSAVAALIQARIQPSRLDGTWDHAFVQARFVGDLINRRGRYSAEHRETLAATIRLRHTADYHYDSVTAPQILRAMRRASRFVEEIEARRGQQA